MRVQFTLHAKNELDDSISFYELQHPGLGVRFKKEVRVAIARILNFPDSFPIVRGSVRKAFVRAFPYRLLFSVEGNSLIILAVAHQHRLPDYWVDR